MSNIYLTQPVRSKHDICWQQEFILGMVCHLGYANVSEILTKSKDVMTQATTHKYLTNLIDRELLEHTASSDRRVKKVKATAKGRKIIKELADVNAVPSVAMS